MTNSDFEEAKRIFDRVVDLPLPERHVLVNASCSANSNVRRYLEKMLAQFDSENVEYDQLPIFNIDYPEGVEQQPFTGNDRFTVRRRLGNGAFGTVYEAYDRERRTTVALKLLDRCKPDSLLRFKREFRTLVTIRHENLIHLYELISDAGRWFFTMELIEGTDFVEYVRSDNSCHVERLRSVLRQLVLAVRSLHAARQLHRDLKPANVLVTSAGRVVVLDFGLVKQLGGEALAQTVSMVGTPAYMSPEQAANLPLSTSSDWYSVGVMLFQALTGKFPYDPSWTHRWTSDDDAQALSPKSLQPDVPQDLNALCLRLLQHAAEQRPNGDEILNAISREEDKNVGITSVQVAEAVEKFCGRQEELCTLQSAFEDSRGGLLQVVLIEGKSGIGKTCLIRQFLRMLQNQNPTLLCLVGKCYEFESVPYKGLDALIDELAQYLQGLPQLKVEALLPRDAFLLPRLFPVLGRVKAIDRAPVLTNVVPDAQELRQRTFSALRELLARVADRQPVVVWIDDLQWSDRDSSLFLAELCAPPSQPPLLLLLSYRADELSPEETLHYLGRTFSKGQKVLGNWRHLTLTGLKQDESLALLRNFLGSNSNDFLANKIVREAGGHPLFLLELARFANSNTAVTSSDEPGVNLRSFLSRRIESLPDTARELLELISMAGQPIPISTLFGSGLTDPSGDLFDGLALLISENLVRTSGANDERRAEPFHDQVRAAVVDLIPRDVRKVRHGQLAKTLAAQPGSESQALVTHYKEAGDLVAAHGAALIAAGAAEGQLAFDRAAMFYEEALETVSSDDPKKENLFVKLADCLGKAGRGKDSADAYLEAGRRSPLNSFDMRRLAAEQLMRSGYIDDSIRLFRELCVETRLEFPATPRKAMLGMALGRVRARLRMLRGLPKPVSGKTPKSRIVRLELIRTGGVTLNLADPVAAAYFQVMHISEALKSHDPAHLATAFGIEASLRVAAGTRNPAKALRLLANAERIAETLGDSNTIGTMYLFRTYIDYLLGWIPQGIEDGRKTIKYLRENCTGVAWELTAGYVLLFWFLCWAGYVEEVRDLLPQLLREGAARGDVNVEVSLRLLSYVHYYYLGDDRPEDCLSESQRALEKWSPSGFYLQHYGAMFTHVESYLYLGEYSRAREYLLKAWEPMSRSFILRWQILRVMGFFLRGRVALACWLGNCGRVDLRKEVEHYAERLKGVRSAWGEPMSRVLLAGLAVGDGRRVEGARMLEESSKQFKEISLHAYSSATAHVSGMLYGDAHGKSSVNAASQFLSSQRIRNPEAFLRMLLPGKWF